jgi:hypothetical protein
VKRRFCFTDGRYKKAPGRHPLRRFFFERIFYPFGAIRFVKKRPRNWTDRKLGGILRPHFLPAVFVAGSLAPPLLILWAGGFR